MKEIENEGAPALRVIRAGTRSTVHRSFPYQSSSYAGQSGAAHAGARDHVKHFFDGTIIDKLSWESNNCCRYCIEDLDIARKVAK